MYIIDITPRSYQKSRLNQNHEWLIVVYLNGPKFERSFTKICKSQCYVMLNNCILIVSYVLIIEKKRQIDRIYFDAMYF